MSQTDYEIASVLAQLTLAEKLGTRTLSNGVRLIGHVPHVGPKAYLHVLFPGLDARRLVKLESAAGRPVPHGLKALYELSNGMHLFSGALSIFGLRSQNSRTGDAAYEVFGVELKNKDERPKWASNEFFFFGFYDWDGSLLYMSAKSPEVYRCAEENVQSLNSWPNLTTMLKQEIERLGSCFDSLGRAISPDKTTAPT